MTVCEMLFEEKGTGTPISCDDLVKCGMSFDTAKQTLSSLCRKGKIKKYSKGIYYFPYKGILGDGSLSVYDVIESKYLKNNKEICGYYSGPFFENRIGITEQVPMSYEIVTNNTSSRKRTVYIGNTEVIIRKPYTEVNNKNCKLLPILDFINRRDISFIKESYKPLADYILKNELSYRELLNVLRYYPSKTSKKMMESGLLNIFKSK